MSAKVIELILSDERVGRGIEGDPVRRVYHLSTLDGRLVATFNARDSNENVVTAEIMNTARPVRP